MTLQEVHEQLMAMHKQFVCPKDTYFLGMAECIQRTIDYLAADDNDIVIDDLFAKVDRLEQENRELRALLVDEVVADPISAVVVAIGEATDPADEIIDEDDEYDDWEDEDDEYAEWSTDQ